MKILQNISDSTPQSMRITLPDGTTATLTLTYRVQQSGWFYDISWDGVSPAWARNGNRLVTSPNILRQSRDLIPFGLTVTTTNNGEPVGKEDFVNGYATVILLDQTDVLNIEAAYYQGFP